MKPSPTAEATRITLAERTSPIAVGRPAVTPTGLAKVFTSQLVTVAARPGILHVD